MKMWSMYIPEIKSENFIFWGEPADYGKKELRGEDAGVSIKDTEGEGEITG